MTDNIILNTDSYKTSHYKQYPAGTEFVSSYIESRGGDYEETTFFGLQMFLKKYLSTPITAEDIDEAEDVITGQGLTFNREGWEHILNEHGGKLPLRIEALPEGTVLDTKNAMVQIINTDPKVPWLTSYMETALLRAVWYPTTVATKSRECKKIMKEFLDKTAMNDDGLEFMLHDFGARGGSSNETVALGGLAHLTNFQGTDTLAALGYARRYYKEKAAGFSIPASEHSTMTCWGRENEKEAYSNMLDQFGGEGKIVAVVSDSYDFWNAIDKIWGEELHDKVVGMGGKLVVRPDSGDPVEVVPKAIKKLMKKFGATKNDKGYYSLPPCIGVIQGDGVSPATIRQILVEMEKQKLCADNIVFGMGGELLQKLDRDTLKFAMKASAALVNGQWRDVYKDPITDPGKTSKKGRLAVVQRQGGLTTIREDQLQQTQENIMETVFINGKITKECTLAEVRERCKLPVPVPPTHIMARRNDFQRVA